ncbi:MAG TPA: 2-succinyl-5-enolpyruvyl-6-hydroxy-3-cyclohexene-1-carboxylic-acid synthase [Acidimicrobiales bacterium]|nr:2-succinyl-5-enolpyruvyl-6-hydroxy-3-cyclohexene-1-carboxylic-acid synthase [Acidimicrobiales bacterium]
MSADAATGLAQALVDEWVRAGVQVVAVAPGSRSTPLALAVAADGRVRVEVFLDERSAGAFALGATKASGRPAVVVTTSGSAAALLHGAVIEAHHSRTPLVVCTADRPPELRDTGASQAIDQVKLFGDAVRWFAEVGVPEDRPGVGAYWRSLATRAVAEAIGPPPGPVHLNLAFREPLVPTGAPVPAPGRDDGAPWTVTRSAPVLPGADDVDHLARAVAEARRGLVMAGWGAAADAPSVERFAAAAGWPVLADAVSGLRGGSHAISTYDALLRHPAFADAHRPDLVLRLGASPTGRAIATWLPGAVRQVLVDPDGAWLDPTRSVHERMASDPTALLDAVADRLTGGQTPTDWLAGWLAAEATARVAIDDLVDAWEAPFEGRIARDVMECLPEGATLVVGSSMPVRDLESFARPRRGVHLVANRGASGIDGFTSTVLGVAAVSDGPVVALSGDLTLLHDVGGLVGATRRGIDATLVVVDNDGGGIFSFLPQAGLTEHFEHLFATPHGTDLVEVATAFGVPASRVTRADHVVAAVGESLAAGGVRVVVVTTDRVDNVARHAAVWEAVAAALDRHRAP